ncbi:T3SS secreted effector IpaH [Escherichia coli]|nr:T3SS secreted effector IpaH [Escherichia coli]
MTNINTACVKNNASYQLNNALPNKETISSNFCERLAQWGNKSLNNGEERAIAVERIKEAYNSNMASLDLSYLDLSELPPIPSTVKEGANKRGNSSRLTQSFHFFMFEPIFSPVNALNQPI